MEKHTPGPWKVVVPKHPLHDVFTHAITTQTGNSLAWAFPPYGDADERARVEANARLMAAAPDLLEACEEFIAYDESDCTDDVHSWAKLKDVMVKTIAKAKGT